MAKARANPVAGLFPYEAIVLRLELIATEV
jgi:hypothetical protein